MDVVGFRRERWPTVVCFLLQLVTTLVSLTLATCQTGESRMWFVQYGLREHLDLSCAGHVSSRPSPSLFPATRTHLPLVVIYR